MNLMYGDTSITNAIPKNNNRFKNAVQIWEK